MRFQKPLLAGFMVLAFHCQCLVSQSARPFEGGDIVRTGDTRVVSIALQSADPQVSALMQRAFRLHGGYRVVASPGEAVFSIRIDPAGSAANLVVSSSRDGGERLRTTVSGSGLRDAVLRACDRAVEATSGAPGFFAGQLAFVGKQRGATEIYTSDLFFTSVRRLTNDRSQVVGPSWAPDGTRILYTSYYKSGFPDIFLIDLSTGRRTQFAGFKGTNTGAVFSPDGTRVAMSLSGNGNAEIYVSNSAGRSLRRLTENKSLEASPAWSPDGSRLVFTSDAPGRPRLFECSANGGPMRALPTNISGYCSEPDWNPRDANLIAFSAAQGGGFQIAVYDARKRSSRWVSSVPGDAVEPCWLRDGRHIVFTNRRSGRKRLMILDSETGRVGELHSPAFGEASHATFVYPRGE